MMLGADRQQVFVHAAAQVGRYTLAEYHDVPLCDLQLDVLANGPPLANEGIRKALAGGDGHDEPAGGFL